MITDTKDIAALVTRLVTKPLASDEDAKNAGALIHSLMLHVGEVVSANDKLANLLADALTLLEVYAPKDTPLTLTGMGVNGDDITIGQFITGVRATLDDFSAPPPAPGPIEVQ